MPTPGSSRFASAIRRFMSSSETGVAHFGRSRCGPWPIPVRQYSFDASSAISAGSCP